MACFFLLLVGVVLLLFRGIGVRFADAHLGWLGLGFLAAGVYLVPVGYAILSR